MKRATKWWIATALLGTLIVPVATVWWMSRPTRVYTDSDLIRRPVAQESPRDILWQPPRPLSEAINAPLDVYEPKFSWDGLTMYFVRGKAGENADLFSAQRTATGWTEPRAITSINTEYEELGPEPSADGSAIYFYSNRPGSLGGYDLWVARKRSDAAPGDVDAWQEPTNLGSQVNSEFNDYGPALASDGKTLFFSSNRPGKDDKPPVDPLTWRATLREDLSRRTYDLYSCKIVDDAPQAAIALDSLNTRQNEGAPSLSPAGDFLYFASDRAGGFGGFDLYRVRRLNDAFGLAQNLGPSVNTLSNELDPSLAQLGFALYFSSNRAIDQQATTQPSASQPATGNTKEPARYAVYYTTSREVFLDADARPIDWAGLWARLWPNLLWLLLGLLAMLLAALLYRDLRDRRLSLLARCLIASVALHCGLMALFGVWRVSTAIGEFVRGGGKIQVSLAAAGLGDSLSIQVRGTAIDGPTVNASSLESPRAELSQPAPEVAAVRLETPPSAIVSVPISQETTRDSQLVESPRPQAVQLAAKPASFTPKVEASDAPSERANEPQLSAPTATRTVARSAVESVSPDSTRVDIAPERRVAQTIGPAFADAEPREAQPSSVTANTSAAIPLSLSRSTAAISGMPMPHAEAQSGTPAAEPEARIAAVAVASSRPSTGFDEMLENGVSRINLSPANSSNSIQALAGSAGDATEARDAATAGSSATYARAVEAPAPRSSMLNVGLPPTDGGGSTGEQASEAVGSAGAPKVAARSTDYRGSVGTGSAGGVPSLIKIDTGLSGSSAAQRQNFALAADVVGDASRSVTPGLAAAAAIPIPLGKPAGSGLSVALPVEPDANETSVSAAPLAMGTLRGVVRDKSSGKPLTGATVRVDLAGSEPVTTTTNETGEYTLALPQTPDFFAVTATAEGYEPGARNMPGEELAQKGLVGDFELEPETEMVIAVEDEPEVHHLGNDAFEGAINSQFQRKSEGAALIGEFNLRETQTVPFVEQAEVKLLVKGVQCPHQILINGRLMRSKIQESPADGSFGEQSVAIEPRLLKQGANTVEVRAVSCRGDLDDFEFVNVQIRLKRRVEAK